MHDVFISYSSVNKPIADAICHRLESEKIKCWYAPRDIAVGENWPAAIVRAIEQSNVFVLIYSEHSNQSKEVLREVMAAADSNCVIIPFRVDESKMDQGLAYYLKGVHWLDAISPPMEANLELLYRRVDSILHSGTAAPDPEPKPPVNIHPPKAKPPKKKWWIVAACLILALSLGAFAASSGLIPLSPKDQVQTITMRNLSHYGMYRYPFLQGSMLSSNQDCFFAEDTQTGEWAYLKADTGRPILEHITHSFQDPTNVNAVATDYYDVIYFFDNMMSSVRIYNKDTGTWVTEEAVSLGLAPWEMITNLIGRQEYMSPGKEHKDELTLLVFDGRTDEQCIGRAIILSPDGSIQSTDLTSYGLSSYLTGLNKPGSHEVIMMDRNDQPRLLNILDLTSPELPVQTILDEYMPYKVDDYATLSPDGRYCFATHTDAGYPVIYVLDLRNGAQIFSETFTMNYQRDFLGDHELIIYNQETSSVYVYDLLTQRKVVKMDRQYFLDNPSFPDVPFTCFFCDTLEACVFVSAVNDGASVKLTVTDVDGKVLAQSDPLSIPFSGEYYIDLVTGDDAMVLMAYTLSEAEIQNNNGVCTELFRADFSFDSEGNLVFGD